MKNINQKVYDFSLFKIIIKIMRKEKKIENHNICQSFEMNFPKFDTNQIFQIQKDIFINSNKLNLIDSYISSKSILSLT